MKDELKSHGIGHEIDLETDVLDEIQTLELLEERAEVVKSSTITGKVVLTKTINTRTVTVPIELKEEVLSIHVVADDDTQAQLKGDYDDQDLIAHIDETKTSAVVLNGKPLALGERVDIVLSRETAVVTKKTHAIEEVSLQTYTDTTTHELATELRREELQVNAESYTDGYSTVP